MIGSNVGLVCMYTPLQIFLVHWHKSPILCILHVVCCSFSDNDHCATFHYDNDLSQPFPAQKHQRLQGLANYASIIFGIIGNPSIIGSEIGITD